MDTTIIFEALDNAITTQKPENGLILHSNSGPQYTLKEYRKAVEISKFKLSYSAKGCPYNNTCIEGYHA